MTLFLFTRDVRATTERGPTNQMHDLFGQRPRYFPIMTFVDIYLSTCCLLHLLMKNVKQMLIISLFTYKIPIKTTKKITVLYPFKALYPYMFNSLLVLS